MQLQRSCRHGTFFCIADGEESSLDELAAQFDLAIDHLHALCLANPLILEALERARTRLQAYTAMLPLLPEAIGDARWIKESSSREILRRVLYLIHPDRFGFDRTGWIH